ncbi:hypothetical protein BESB_061420 [Besnoitia besnoiti]|uniref:Uncharacterized protein n=1 Tax=Besnoitia besnoiti TaxID=94643 RepID=A0A2A9MBA1_BESBE|nr:hypothetical protein BESB_061420 [Besnoitia besnoiti]PFH35255.1 hypothetical protein BESB_061420 [Besnoitia besnoiti]
MSRDQAQRAAAACGSPQGLAASGAEQDPQPQQQAAPSGSFASAASSWSPPASSQLTAARDGARDAQRPPGNERRRRRSRERENRGERRNSSSTHGRHRHGCERDIQGAEDAGRGKDTRRHHHREGGEGERREDKREEGGRGHDRRDAEKRSSHVAQLRSGDSKAGRAPSRVRETGYCPEAYRRNASRGARRDGESRRERNDSERKQWGPRREEAPRAPHSGAPCSSERPGTQDGAARACEGSDIRGSCEARACHPARARDACRPESSLPRARGEESACRRAREEDLREEAQHRRRRDDAHVDSGRLGRHSRRASASRRDEGRPRNEKERRREGERERSASLHGWWRRESHGGRREDESRRSWTLAGQPERTPENEGRRTPSSHRHRSRKEERREEHHSRHASLEERPDKQERNHAPTELPQTDAARGVREKGKQTLEADRRRSSRGERDGQECRRKHRHREKHSSASPFSGSSSQRGSREHTPSSASPPLSSSLPSRETYPPFATCDANREGADAPSQRNPHTGTGEWRPGNFAVSAHAFVASAQASQPAGGIDNALSPPSVYPAACLPGSAAFSPGIFLSCTSTAGAAATDPAVYTVGPSAAPAVVLTPRAACAELSSQERFNFHSAELREGDASAGRAAAAHWDLLRAVARGPPQDRADGDASAAGATPGGVYTRAGLADALSPACVLRPRSSSDLPHRSGPEPSVSSGALCVEPERHAGASFAFAASAPPAPERPCKPSSFQSFFSSVAREEASSSSVPAPPRHALPSAASLSSAGAAPPPFSLSFAAQPQPQQRQDPQRADPGEPDWARNQGVSSLGRQPAAVPASRSQLRVFGSPTPSRPAPPAPPPPPPPPDASAPSRFAAVSVPGGGGTPTARRLRLSSRERRPRRLLRGSA